MRPYFNVCEYCKANLDPGEICDCRTKSEQKEKVLPPTKVQHQSNQRVAAIPVPLYGGQH